MISISAAVKVVLYLVVGGLIFFLLSWLVDFCKTPEPWRQVARVVLAILAVFVIIGILLSLLGGYDIFRP